MARNKVKVSGGSDISSLKQKLRSNRRSLHRNTRNTARRSAKKTVFLMKEEIVSNNAVATTELFHSFSTFLKDNLRGGRHSFSVSIQNRADHSEYVEFGTGAFHNGRADVPSFTSPSFSGHLVGQIQLWLLEKPALRSPVTAGSAFAIAHAIANGSGSHPPGTPAQPFFVNTWRNEGRHIFVGRMRAAVRNSV